MSRRPYRLGKRAGSRNATRARIVAALIELHEEVGPRNATISAIAERAGVQRLTVYRHFPDDGDLFQACTSRWLELNPPPDPSAWEGIADGLARCRAAYGALYGYFRTTQRMWEVSYRDEPEVPALQAPMTAFRAYLDGIADALVNALPVPAQRRRNVAVTVAHCVQFATWASLVERGLDDAEAAELATRWVRSLLAAADTGRLPAEVDVVLRDEQGDPILSATATLVSRVGAASAAILPAKRKKNRG